MIFPFIHKNRLEIFLYVIGKTLDAYQKDKKIYHFPAQQRLDCRVSGEFCDIHGARKFPYPLLIHNGKNPR